VVNIQRFLENDSKGLESEISLVMKFTYGINYKEIVVGDLSRAPFDQKFASFDLVQFECCANCTA
jgi:hypothetical protein